MPGHVLIFDPMVTNRLMLKAQLAQDFFEVSLAAEPVEFFDALRQRPPDVILLSYASERLNEFAAIHRVRNTPNVSHLPIVFLNNGDDPHIWDQSHDCLVDDVLGYSSDRWLLTARLNLLIRGKERVDALFARQRTISDMGFAEDMPMFPPPLTQAVTLDFSGASASFNAEYLLDLKTLLRRDFPMLDVRAHPGKPDDRPADICVLDSETLGRDRGFAVLCALRKTAETSGTQAVYVSRQRSTKCSHRAIELGAKDFVLGPPSVPELACRLRRLVWQRHMEIHAERSVSHHLKSALIDPLTGLYNRRYAFQYLNRVLQRRPGKNTSVTVMVLDLDRFKSINDTYGHVTGDSVICETANRLRANLRSADLVARLGGEEFLIVLTDTSLPTIRDIAERLRSTISGRPFKTSDGLVLPVSASIGVSATQVNWDSPNALIENADSALYVAKDNGRNQVTFNYHAA